MNIEVREMWPDGPLRRWSAENIPGSTITYNAGGNVGGYVCAACKEPAVGVYRTSDGWKCRACRDNRQQILIAA